MPVVAVVAGAVIAAIGTGVVMAGSGDDDKPLQGDTYDKAASVIRTGEDYRDITYEYLVKCAGEGAIYVELTASPDHAKFF